MRVILVAGVMGIFCAVVTAQTIPAYNQTVDRSDTSRVVAFVGDTQVRSDWEFWRENNEPAVNAVLHEIAEARPPLIVILGDLVFRGSSALQWRAFDSMAAEIRQTHAAIYPLFGNHEYFGKISDGKQNFFARFPNPDGTTWRSIRFRSLGIVLLNSNFGELTAGEAKEQQTWYLNQLRNFEDDPAIHHIIVCCHHPPYTNSSVVSDDVQVQQDFVQQFNRSPKGKVFFTGHCHAYEHFVMNGKQFVVSGGCGPRQKLVTDPGKRHHEDVFHGAPVRHHHYCRVVVSPNALRIQMVGVDESLRTWNVEDDFTTN